MKLPPAPWQAREGLDHLLAALGGGEGLTRYVGGAVRDALAGLAVQDIDCATALKPEQTIARVRAAGFKAVPTGLAHGTVTAILPGGPVEVTTLRRDVATDGRRATVAFTDDWREDAARRDFTINALSADPASGDVHDYFGGVEDLAAGRVRFIGDPLTRIAEDHLRILRFFRFHARFGRGEPEAADLAACTARANDLMALSRERIADELLKLLALPDPLPTVRLMIEHAILRPVLPEIGAEGVAHLARLVARERRLGIAPAGLRRLAALLPREPALAFQIGTRLKLSNVARAFLRLCASPIGEAPPHAIGWRHPREAIDLILLSDWAEEAVDAGIAFLGEWERPQFPLKGGDLVALGIGPGPSVAKALQTIEREWVDAGFPGSGWVEARAREMARG
ncbi:MAG TPA: CCA tRNA nucleotidyltransferase [Sphingomonadaceae bacterium]|nr:CCA tRNA nucleotidyltransferase [Sphingomonadaceae bacterium]